MGILEELGLTEDDLNPFAHPASVAGEPIPVEALDAADAAEAAEAAERVSPSPGELPPIDPHATECTDFAGLMGSAEDPKPVKAKSKGKRVVYSVRCTLNLSGSDYSVELLPTSEDYDKAYRLTKVDAQKPTGYNVIQVDGETICECYDFRHRHESAVGSKGCKHIRGLVDMGMFTAQPQVERFRSRTFDS